MMEHLVEEKEGEREEEEDPYELIQNYSQENQTTKRAYVACYLLCEKEK